MRLVELPYRALQKLAVFEIAQTLAASTEGLAAGPSKSGVVALDKEALVRHAARGDAPGCGPFLGRMGEPRMHCFGAIADGRLVSFAWMHEGEAEAGMNFGYHPGTATAVRLADDAAFVFHLHTSPEARGQGWISAVLRHAAVTLRAERGVATFVTTTEVVNLRARSALARAGFRERGAYCRFGVGRWTAGWYPAPQAPVLAFG